MRCAWLLVALAIALSGSALAQQPADSASRQAARILGEEGDRLFDSGDYQAALDKYEKALAIVDVPTLRLREAYCLEKLGKLVEAAERTLSLSRTELAAEAPPEHRDAVALAAERHTSLARRIPVLFVRYDGERSDLAVALDGKPFDVAQLGERQLVNPGHHRLDARRGDSLFVRELDMAEATVANITIELAVHRKPPVAARLPLPVIAPPIESPPIAKRSGVRVGSVLWGVGWTAVALGGAGIIVGAVSGGLALDKKNELEALCGEELACPPPQHEDADDYNRLRVTMTVGFAVGAPLAAGGIALLVASAFAPDDGDETVWLRLTPTSMAVGARF